MLCLIFSLTKNDILRLENPKVFSPQKESLSSNSRKESLYPFEVKSCFLFLLIKICFFFGGVTDCVCLFFFSDNSVGRRRYRTRERLWQMFAFSMAMDSELDLEPL